MKKPYEQQDGESCAAFEAFKIFLQERCVKSVAETIQKSYTATRRLASRYNWAERCRAFDADALEITRQTISRNLANNILELWTDCLELQDLAFDAAQKKEWKSASLRTLNEVYQAAFERQLKILELLKLSNDATADDQRTLTININPKTTLTPNERN